MRFGRIGKQQEKSGWI